MLVLYTLSRYHNNHLLLSFPDLTNPCRFSDSEFRPACFNSSVVSMPFATSRMRCAICSTFIL